MDKREYITWFENTRMFFGEYMDSSIADELLHYEIFSAVWSCIEENENEEPNKQIKELIVALLRSLEAVDFFREELLNAFLDNSQRYQEFIEEYHLPDETFLRDVGSFWLRTVDKIDDAGDKAKRVDFSKKACEYCLWLMPYCTIFTYQYLIENPNCGKFVAERLSVLQYWEYREIENYLDKINHLSLEEQILKISRRYCETEFDIRFSDRESLYMELLDRGLPISESFVITNRVRKGRGLTDIAYEKLVNMGYERELLEEVNTIKYLKSRRNAIVSFLFVKELV